MDKKTFCILPFLHFYTQPDGEVKPCCIAGGFDTPQSLRKNSIEEIFNSDEYKQLRKDMLTGERNKVCDVCYKKEDAGETSPRHIYNHNLTIGGPCKWTIPEVNEDYSVAVEFQHLDIRFSNLCNFKCRMCNHSFSSNWYEDSKKITVNNEQVFASLENTKVLQASKTITNDILPYIKNVKSIYFAGGEPLINEDHYELLVWLSKNLEDTDLTSGLGLRKKVTMHYNTNLSILKYRDYDFINHWNMFKRVHLAISCDGIGKVGEYQRTGFSHDNFVKNLTELKRCAVPAPTYSPIDGISYSFQYTTTIFNIEHIFDFIDFMIENNFIENSEVISFYYAWGPKYLTLNNLAEEDKKRISKTFLEKIQKIQSEKTRNELIALLNFMNSERTCELSHVKELITQLDDVNNTNYKDIVTLNLVDTK